jgi:hypothetical protein
MKLAKDFLSRFHALTPPDDAVRRAVADAVSSIAGIPATKKDVSIARGVAFVKTSSVAKSSLRMHRIEILEQVFHALPKARDAIRDIR